MPLIRIERPRETEYPPYVRYVLEGFPAADALPTLASQAGDLRALVAPLDESMGSHRYAPGKWTIKETLGHLIDQERVFADRLLRVARGDMNHLPEFNHERFARHAHSGARPFSDLVQEFEWVRLGNLLMIRALVPQDLDRTGRVGTHTFTARALVFLMAAHGEHHLRILRKCYLASDEPARGMLES